MCLMNSVLCPYLDKFVIILIDDILIYSKYEEEYAKHIEIVMEFLKEHQLYAKLRKCSFFQIEVHYLGNVFSKEVIVLYPEKIMDIMEWEAPRNVDEVSSFMGL